MTDPGAGEAAGGWPWRAWTNALAVGLIGGAIFWRLNMPLAWMLGAMFAVTFASIAGLAASVPRELNRWTTVALGLVLGCGFEPGFFAAVTRWTVSLSAMCAYVAATTLAAMAWYRRLGMGPATAYFSAAPGGLNLMTAVGAAYGGDDRTIALVHSLRILLVVGSVPLWFRFAGLYQPAQAARLAAHLWQVSAIDLGVLAACALAGAFAGRLVRLPAPTLTGPMFLSAALHVAGLTAVKPPIELVFVAQLVSGAALGARFSGVKLRNLLMPTLASLGSTVLMLGGAVGCAEAIGLTGLSPDAVLLAFVPGGLAEMSLVALALGADVPFVSTHHMVRIVLVMLAVPPVFRIMTRRAKRRREAASLDRGP